MKKIILSIFCTSVLPVVLSAQPTIANNEFYHVGDVLQMVNCSTAGVSAGAAGADVTWDFSTLSALGVSVTTVAADTSSMFPTSNLLITFPDGNEEHMAENNTDSYVQGINDPTTSTLVNYYTYDIAKRPMSYNTVYYVDTYRAIIATPYSHGTGNLTLTGDAYGTLKLPTGTYNNVLRERKYQYELDSIGTNTSFTLTISYLWFDGVDAAPLLRIDSVSSPSVTSNDVMYLSMPTGFENQYVQQNDFKGCVTDNELILNGNFINGRAYNVMVYNIVGTTILNDDFIASGNYEHINMNNNIMPGMYLVRITDKNDPLTKEIIRVVRY